jgi:AcrR family transcriptional regulator
LTQIRSPEASSCKIPCLSGIIRLSSKSYFAANKELAPLHRKIIEKYFKKNVKTFFVSKVLCTFAPKFFSQKVENRMVKQRIIEEASELFVRSGVKSTTMDDIARHLGISKRTIYENFKDKEELLIACFDAFHAESRTFSQKVFHEADNVAEAILTMLRRDTEKALRRKFDMLDDIRKYYPQIYRKHLTHFQHDKGMEFEQMLKRGITEGVFRENLNPEIIVHLFCRQPEDIMHDDWYLNKFSLTDVFENLVITFLRGICTAKGIEILDRPKM